MEREKGIFLQNLAPGVTERQLSEFYSKFGKVTKIQMNLTKSRDNSAQVYFEDAATARTIINSSIIPYYINSQTGKYQHTSVSEVPVRKTLYITSVPKDIYDEDEIVKILTDLTGIRPASFELYTDKNNESKGSGWAIYDTEKAALDVINKLAELRKSGKTDIGAVYAKARNYNEETTRNVKSLFIKGITKDVTESDLFELFKEYNPKKCLIPLDKVTGEKLPHAIIRFYTREDAEKAMEKVKDVKMGARRLNVKWCVPNFKANGRTKPRNSGGRRRQQKGDRGGGRDAKNYYSSKGYYDYGNYSNDRWANSGYSTSFNSRGANVYNYYAMNANRSYFKNGTTPAGYGYTNQGGTNPASQVYARGMQSAYRGGNYNQYYVGTVGYNYYNARENTTNNFEKAAKIRAPSTTTGNIDLTSGNRSDQQIPKPSYASPKGSESHSFGSKGGSRDASHTDDSAYSYSDRILNFEISKERFEKGDTSVGINALRNRISPRGTGTSDISIKPLSVKFDRVGSEKRDAGLFIRGGTEGGTGYYSYKMKSLNAKSWTGKFPESVDTGTRNYFFESGTKSPKSVAASGSGRSEGFHSVQFSFGADEPDSKRTRSFNGSKF